jgi:LPXTG-site transpeptidase (sortase) family protein
MIKVRHQTIKANFTEISGKRRRQLAPALGVLSVLLLVAGLFFGYKFISDQWALKKQETRQNTENPSPSSQPTSATEPTSLVIKNLKVSAAIVPVALNTDRSLQIPSKSMDVGWYVRSAQPGEKGTAIMTGHLDTATGPAVFWNLKNLKPGDQIEISRSNQTVAVFRVDKVERYSQDNFPDQQVYGTADYPALRLITCAGTYSRSLGRYSDNLVVYASLVNITTKQT